MNDLEILEAFEKKLKYVIDIYCIAVGKGYLILDMYMKANCIVVCLVDEDNNTTSGTYVLQDRNKYVSEDYVENVVLAFFNTLIKEKV
jgi:hypothetical protein